MNVLVRAKEWRKLVLPPEVRMIWITGYDEESRHPQIPIAVIEPNSVV